MLSFEEFWDWNKIRHLMTLPALMKCLSCLLELKCLLKSIWLLFNVYVYGPYAYFFLSLHILVSFSYKECVLQSYSLPLVVLTLSNEVFILFYIYYYILMSPLSLTHGRVRMYVRIYLKGNTLGWVWILSNTLLTSCWFSSGYTERVQ